MVSIWLPYGKTEVHISIANENLAGIVEVGSKPGIKDINHEVERILKELISSEKIVKIRGTEGKIALSLNDIDADLAKLIVSSILREVGSAGLKSESVTVVIANNPFTLRTPRTVEPLMEEITSLGVKAVMHDPIRGKTRAFSVEDGIEIHLSESFTEADVKIMVSTIEPNPYTLYNCCESGISFGLTSLETIKNIILPILDAEDLQEKIFKESVKISKTIKLDFSIGIVRNLYGEVIECFAGDPERVLEESLKVINSLYKVVLKEEADIVIISPGGSPFDKDIFSAFMCLENALKAVRRNGTIILIAECSEGYGELERCQILRKVDGDLSSLEKALRSDFSIDGFIAYRFLRTLKKTNVVMVSSIPDYYVSRIPSLKIFRTANEALNYALGKFGARAKAIVIPHGTLIIPIVEKQK